MHREYRAVLFWRPTLAAKALGFSVLSGLMEGAAILLLIPVLSHSQGGQFPRQEIVLRWLGLGAEQLVAAGIGAFCLLGLLSSLARYLAEKACLRLRAEIEDTARQRMSRALSNMDWALFQSMQLGSVSQALTTDPSQLAGGAFFFVRGIASCLTAGLFLCATFVISAPNTLFTMAFAGASYGLLRIAGRRAATLGDRLSALSERLQITIRDLFDNLKFVRSTGGLQALGRNSDNISQSFADAYVDCHAATQATRSVLEGGGIVYIALLLLVNLGLGYMPLAETLVFLGIFYRTVPRILQAQESLTYAKAYIAWLAAWTRRLEHALAHPAAPCGSALPASRGGLDIRDLNFRYPASGDVALEGINLSVAEGEAVAIVGPSGSGKSTLLDIITGLLRQTGGEARISGLPLSELDREAWQRRIGLVQQDSPVFHGTVLENVCWGAADLDAARAELALTQADAWDFVQSLPEGLHTQVGEKGGRLSGGQRQRIALARALYRQPDLLLLDEPTSSLDAASEQQIIQTLSRIKGQVSMVLVTHRLKAVSLADRILVLEGGRIVEQGTFTELSGRREGPFARLSRDRVPACGEEARP